MMENLTLLRSAAIHAAAQGGELGVPTTIQILSTGVQVRCTPMPGRFSAIGNLQQLLPWDSFFWMGGESNPINDVIDALHLYYINRIKVA